MKVAIIEDEKEFSTLLKNHIDRYVEEIGYDVETTIFDNPNIFLDKYNNELYDVIFIDINMPQMNGMEVAKRIRKLHSHTIIVFVTNMPQYAIQGYSVNAFDFIVKPVPYKLFKSHFDRIVYHYSLQEESLINVKIGRTYQQLKISDIYYIEMINHTAIWHTKTGNYQGTDKSLNEIEKMLPLDRFCKCSKAYLINLEHVHSLKQDTIKVHNLCIKITRTFKQQFMSSFSNFLSKFRGE